MQKYGLLFGELISLVTTFFFLSKIRKAPDVSKNESRY